MGSSPCAARPLSPFSSGRRRRRRARRPRREPSTRLGRRASSRACARAPRPSRACEEASRRLITHTKAFPAPRRLRARRRREARLRTIAVPSLPRRPRRTRRTKHTAIFNPRSHGSGFDGGFSGEHSAWRRRKDAIWSRKRRRHSSRTHAPRGARPRAMGKEKGVGDRQKYRCGDRNPCPHGKLKSNCADCNPCPHGKRKAAARTATRARIAS